MFFFFICFWRSSCSFFVIFSSVALHRGRPAAKCHPRWQPTKRFAVNWGLGRRRIRTQDCRTTVWCTTIELPCLPIEPLCLPKGGMSLYILVLVQICVSFEITVYDSLMYIWCHKKRVGVSQLKDVLQCFIYCKTVPFNFEINQKYPKQLQQVRKFTLSTHTEENERNLASLSAHNSWETY
jgi:hypothetical protein